MKYIQDTDSSRHHSKPGGDQILQFAQGSLEASINFLRDRRKLAVFVVLWTCVIICVITCVIFLYACLRAIIPVDGIHNINGTLIGNDFIVFYSSALLALEGKAASAYDLVTLNAFQHDTLGVEPGDLPWRYPPVYFFFLLPFTYLSYLGAFWAWSALTVTALMLVVRQITITWYLPLLVPLCLPVTYTMVTGQNGNLTATVIGAGLIMLPRSAIVAGMIFGLLAYKPQLAVVVPFCLLAGRYYIAFTSMMVCAFVLGLISWLVFGTDTWIAFFQGVASRSSSIYGTVLGVWERVPTVIITALESFDSSRTAWIFQACVSFLAITIAAWVWRKSTKPDVRAIAIVAATPLASPYVFDYDMAILIIPIAFLASEAWKSKWTLGKLILLLSMWFSEPALRVMSGIIGLQLGPFLWAVLLSYSAFIVNQEQRRTARQGV